MNLVVFDIDGTLTLGDGLGTTCFFEAFEETFGSGAADRRLHSYRESTDTGIAREAFWRARGRAPGTGEVELFKAAYLGRLEAEIARRPGAYRPVPGAGQVLSMLAAEPGWRVAIATGNWRRAAALKLECAGLSRPTVAACSEDGETRRDVLAAAVAAATGTIGEAARGGFERVVYVGDQPWDLEAARAAGAAFVGVGSGPRRDVLEREGARVLDSYLEVDAFLDALSA